MITVHNVADAVHTSRRNRERRFREATGSSVFAEIRRLRMQRAQRMLVDTDQPIKGIAAACGFSSGAQMAHGFSEFVSEPLRQYRDKYADVPHRLTRRRASLAQRPRRAANRQLNVAY